MPSTAQLPKASMNEAHDQDPFNNNSYGTLVDCDYKLVNLPVLDVHDFNERIIRGYEEGYGEKDLPADLLAGPLAGPGRHRHPARLQQHRSGNSRSTSRKTAPAAWTASPSARTPPFSARSSPRRNWNEKLKTIPEADRDMFAKQWSQDEEVLRRRQEEGLATAACSTSSSTRPSARAVPSASPSATTTPSR